MKYSSKSNIQSKGMKYGEQIRKKRAGVWNTVIKSEIQSRGMKYSEQIRNTEQGYEMP